MSVYKVPFNKPCFLGPEVERMKEAIASDHLAGRGKFTKKCEDILTNYHGSPTLLCTSATHALEIAALVLDFKSDDEVILPSFTFVSTANAFALRGATLRFVDNDEFGNLDLESCKKALTARTKAIVVMHYAGNCTDMDALTKWCGQNKVYLIEDAAQSIGAKFKGKPLGTFGTFGCLSFHDTKNITCGEGGALIVNHSSFLSRVQIVREKGTNREQFLQGIVDKYTWVELGSSYILSDMNAAYLSVQLEALEAINQRRKMLWELYKKTLQEPLKKVGVRVLEIPPHNTPNYHLFALLMKSSAQRLEFMTYLKEKSILAPFHYVALHSSPMGTRYRFSQMNHFHHASNCTKFSECLVRLPLYYSLSDSDQQYVIHSIHEWVTR